MSKNREIDPPRDQPADLTANRSDKCQGMGVGSVAVQNIVMKRFDQVSDPIAGPWIDFTVHGYRKHRKLRFTGLLRHRGIGLTHQMTANPPIAETLQKIQGLLLTAAPGALGVDMKDVNF